MQLGIKTLLNITIGGNKMYFCKKFTKYEKTDFVFRTYFNL